MKVAAAILAMVWAVLPGVSKPAAWHGIVPLHSTREDVERLLGAGTDGCRCMYYLADANVSLVYSAGDCEKGGSGGWNVPPDTVLGLTVYQKPSPRISDLGLDESKFKKSQSIGGIMEYRNEQEGLSLEVYDGRVQSFQYLPAVTDEHLRCPGYNGIFFSSDVPKEARATLLQRLNEFVQYSSTYQYEQQYRLYLPEAAALMFSAKNEEQFAKWARESGFFRASLIEFKPQTITMEEDKTFGKVCEISGLAKSSESGKIIESVRVTRAVLRDGQWYFVDLFRLGPG